MVHCEVLLRFLDEERYDSGNIKLIQYLSGRDIPNWYKTANDSANKKLDLIDLGDIHMNVNLRMGSNGIIRNQSLRPKLAAASRAFLPKYCSLHSFLSSSILS